MPEQRQQQQPNLLDQVHTLTTQAGVKRDGTNFESPDYTDAVWCRFQRGRPKKIGGYRRSFQTPNGLPRSLITQTIDGNLYVYTGYSGGIDVFTAATNNIEGVGPFPASVLNTYGQTAITSVTNQTTFVVAGDKTGLFPAMSQIVFGSLTSTTLFTVASATMSGTSPNIITTIVTTTAFTGTPTLVFRYADALNVFADDPRRIWQFDVQFNENKRSLQLLAHSGLNLQNIDATTPQPIYTGGILPDANGNWSLSPLADTEGQNPTNQLILVDGGVVSLYPFIFGYGSNGLLVNNHVNQDYAQRTFNDWNGAFANQNNVAAGKIVKGIPLRGGTNSPSGLFWAVDSLIRVSFNAGAAAGNFWSYDLIASRTSIMSSNAVAQMDGGIFWMGIDRFYVFNGNVAVLPNDKNLNYLFDNINYSQRQKVWCTTIPRYNEIWWFYPRGTSLECNDAIIYNVKDRIWYDAGLALGARRTCGYTTEVFPRPVWAGWEPQNTYFAGQAVIATPSGQTPATNRSFYLFGDQTTAFAPGSYVSLRNTTPETIIQIESSEFIFITGVNATYVTLVSDIAMSPLTIGTVVYATYQSGYPVWEHEFGVDRIEGTSASAIQSSFETQDHGLVGGLGLKDNPQSPTVRTRITRIEPDFVQTGPMTVQIVGRAYPASTNIQRSEIYTFGAGTANPEKIDVRNAENRLFRFKFESNTIGGNYEQGRVLFTFDSGDTRP